MTFNKKAIFLDRDGTIIYDVGYPNNPDQVCLLPWVGETLSEFQKNRFLLIIISNQSGIGRGLITIEQAEKVHNEVILSLMKFDVSIDASYYCPHSPEDKCRCRKPLPEMILRAAKEFDIDLAQSFMIGDTQTDIETGIRAGCHPIFIGTQSIAGTENFVAKDWRDIKRYILEIIGNK
jgi:histidinol-phosphate phosphatase family protein